MPEKPRRYQTVLLDWGDTVMRDHPEITTPMVDWETIEVIEGIEDVLEYLHASGRRIVLATSADISDPGQIRNALARGGLETYFSHIYCFRNTNLPKGEAFYRHILNDLGIPGSKALMVGDNFSKDVEAANTVGISAVWFNPRSDETCKSDAHVTVHTMQELREFFKSLDEN